MHTGKSIKLVAVMAAATLFCAGCADRAAQTINDISSDAVTDVWIRLRISPVRFWLFPSRPV